MNARRSGILLLALIFAAPLPPPAQAQDFVLHSQNMLRFGHGQRILVRGQLSGRRMFFQCLAFNDIMRVADIILVQEMMFDTTTSPCNPPGTHQWRVRSTPPAGSYREYYAFLSPASPRRDSSNNVVGPTVTYANVEQQASTASFMRPPWALLFNVTPLNATQSKPVWIVNFHARFTGGF
jgi:hypothetical protein